MNEADFWENRLNGLGMGAKLKSEEEKAAEAGVEIVSMEALDPEFKAMQSKLAQEDPRNKFGGFPESMDNLVSLVETLYSEWAEENGSERVGVVVHSSCINGEDCVTVAKGDGERYHYNTKNIRNYSRTKIMSGLSSLGIAVKEK